MGGDETAMTRRGSLPLALCVVLCVTAACSDETDPAGGGGQGEGVTGVVARQKTGVGVEGVTLSILSSGRVVAAAATAADGSFASGPIPDGTYEVVPVGLELAGLDPRYDVMEPARDTVQVASGSGPELVFAVVGLVPARITGEVTCGGQPDPGAVVRVAGGGATNVSATADALGRYAALDLLPGVYTAIPESGRCPLSPAYVILDLRPGEFGRADFGG